MQKVALLQFQTDLSTDKSTRWQDDRETPNVGQDALESALEISRELHGRKTCTKLFYMHASYPCQLWYHLLT